LIAGGDLFEKIAAHSFKNAGHVRVRLLRLVAISLKKSVRNF